MPNLQIRGAQIKDAFFGAGLQRNSGDDNIAEVLVDDSSIEINADALQIKASGVTNDMLAGSIADGKLAQDYIQTSEVDGSSIEFAGSSLNVKALGVTNAMLAGSIAFSKMVDLTTARALVSDGSGDVSVSDVTATELGYLDGVTSSVQNQINAISSGYNRRNAVINIVDNTAVPPTEVSGDRYILDETGGGVHANWDGASANDIVEFDGASWVAVTPSEGYVCYVDTSDVDAIFIDDGSPAWETRSVVANALTDGKIFIGNVSNIATAQDVSGDITITNAGVTAIGNDKVTKEMINSDVAGTGILQNVDGSLELNVDDSSIELASGEVLQVKALGITNAMLAGSIADGKLVEDYIKTSEVDDSSIEFTGSTLNVKALGIVNAMIAEDTIAESKIDVFNAPSIGLVLGYTSNGLEWISGASGSIAESDIQVENESANCNGATTVFTLSNTPIANSLQVFLNGLLQEEGSGKDYTYSGTTVTFVEAPLSGDILIVHYTIDN